MAHTDHAEQVHSFVPKETQFLHVGQGFGATIELKDGNLMASTASGRAVSQDGGSTWTEAIPMCWQSGERIEFVFRHFRRLPSGAIGGFYRPPDRNEERYGMSDWFARSEDEGLSWSAPVRIGEPYQNVCLHSGIVVTTSGRIVAPVYTLIGQTMRERGRASFCDGTVLVGHHGYEHFFTYCWAYYSDDEGGTWQPNRGKGFWCGGGELFVTLDESHGGHFRANEPVAVEVSAGHLLMILRTPLGRLYQSWSDDNGETWSLPEPTSLASALAPAAIGRLPDGSGILIVWNQASPDEIERGMQRIRLSTAVSRDGGATWSHGRNVFSIFCKEGDRSYVEPPPPASYRAAMHAPRIPPCDMEGTYPFLEFWKDRAVIRFSTTSRRYYIVDHEGRTGYDRGPQEKAHLKADVCMGLPVSWFSEKLKKYS